MSRVGDVGVHAGLHAAALMPEAQRMAALVAPVVTLHRSGRESAAPPR